MTDLILLIYYYFLNFLFLFLFLFRCLGWDLVVVLKLAKILAFVVMFLLVLQILVFLSGSYLTQDIDLMQLHDILWIQYHFHEETNVAKYDYEEVLFLYEYYRHLSIDFFPETMFVSYILPFLTFPPTQLHL